MWSMDRQEGFLQDEGKHARMFTDASGSFRTLVTSQSGKPRHALCYDSLLTITDGRLDRHCQGCGGWDSDSGWKHPVPPLCVFQVSDFL